MCQANDLLVLTANDMTACKASGRADKNTVASYLLCLRRGAAAASICLSESGLAPKEGGPLEA